MPVTILELDKVAKHYGADNTAVADVSFSIEKGEFIALMGPSGCGKTTTLRMIAGLEQPSAGDIRLWGRRMNDDAPWDRDTPLVWQNYALFPFLSVRKNVEFGLKQRGIAAHRRKEKAEEWLSRMGLAEFANRLPSQLSGGQKQRVALARALATEPEVLLLDEPLSALDPHLKVKMQSELVRLHRELGITFVCVTHSHSEAFAMADRVVIMNEGRVQQIGSPRDIHRQAANRFVAEFLGGSNLFRGRVVTRESSGVIVDTEIGHIRVSVAVDAETRLHAETTLVIATDRIGISRTATARDNEIVAKVSTLEYIGAAVTFFMETDSGVEFGAQISSREFDENPIAVGETVFASWSADSGYLLYDACVAYDAHDTTGAALHKRFTYYGATS
jgi:spermidine/putrescine transport system ATP-binding protein